MLQDVASRGLHLPHVQWIVQYTTPGVATEYIHRVGRTARAGKKGNSLLFVLPSEVEYIKTLQDYGISMTELQMTDILQTLVVAVRDVVSTTETKRQLPRTYEESATYLQMCFENHIVEHSKMHQLATKAYQSFIRAYATYPSSLKSIFHVKHLHLGHLAKSFGLREAPADIGRSTKGYNSKGAGHKFQRPDDRNRYSKA
ncbi:hypothetical protein FSP39_019605 [Pinctada imbricata]|uniref:ATP-dependent RNA helicase n=1 Tax=Pinctada imbricata TaxID=66713 RepID=A0AA88XNA2_PINIB|nr:hypothetical protein FSP39_019605 [Pinctada imbricata]